MAPPSKIDAAQALVEKLEQEQRKNLERLAADQRDAEVAFEAIVSDGDPKALARHTEFTTRIAAGQVRAARATAALQEARIALAAARNEKAVAAALAAREAARQSGSRLTALAARFKAELAKARAADAELCAAAHRAYYEIQVEARGAVPAPSGISKWQDAAATPDALYAASWVLGSSAAEAALASVVAEMHGGAK